MGTFSEDYPEFQGAGTSRDRIVRSYAAQDAARARSARMYSQEASQAYKQNAARARERAAQREALDARRREEEAMRAAQRAAQREMEAANMRTNASVRGAAGRPSVPRTRVANPLTSQERHEMTRMSQENYERARAARDVLSSERQTRTTNRELIDGRGSIDSRAFNENHELIGYTIDERDRHEPMLDTNESKSRWRSHNGQDASGGAPVRGGMNPRPRTQVGFSGSVMSGQRNYTAPKTGLAGIPLFVKVAVPVIIVLIVILVRLLVP